MTPPKYICPACRQKTGVDILYGMPDTEAQQMAERGRSSWAVAALTWQAQSGNAPRAAINGASSAGSAQKKTNCWSGTGYPIC